MRPFVRKCLNCITYGVWTDCPHPKWEMDRDTWDQYCVVCMDTPTRKAVREEFEKNNEHARNAGRAYAQAGYTCAAAYDDWRARRDRGELPEQIIASILKGGERDERQERQGQEVLTAPGRPSEGPTVGDGAAKLPDGPWLDTGPCGEA